MLEQEIFPKYNVDRARVLLVGYSGGAEFTTQNLVPQHADLLCGGGAVIFGGGGRPWGRGTMFAPEFVSAFKMHWYTGQDDTGCSDCSCDGFDAFSASTGGADYYEARGFTVTLEQPEGIDHCNIPFDMVIEEQLNAGILP